MRTRQLFLILLTCSISSALSQVRVDVKEGENTLRIDIYNRSDQTLNNLQTQFTIDRPGWVILRSGASGQLTEYRGEKGLRRSRLTLQLPFYVAGLDPDKRQAKIALTNENRLIGTFSVLLGGPTLSGSLSSLTSERSAELASNEILSDKQPVIEQIPFQTSILAIPSVFRLKPNFPNPFNPVTSIPFDLPEPGVVVLKIYDVLSQEVKTLVNGEKAAGFHRVNWNAKNEDGLDVPSGMYIYRIAYGTVVAAQKMLLVR